MSGAVTRAVRLALPTEASTAALRAALWEGDAGRAAFDSWVARVGDPRDLPSDQRQAVRELAPQLDEARRGHGAPAPGALGVLLHAAADHERRRWTPYRNAAVDLLGDEAEPLVTGGLATALAAHPEPALRHCHDLDRLGPAPATATHPSGLPTVVHQGLLPPAWGADEDLDALRSRSVADDRLGRPIRRLGVGDLLVTVLVHSIAGGRGHSVRWASDVSLLARVATEGDWAVVSRTVTDHCLGPVVLPSLRFVADDLCGAVPTAVVDEVVDLPGPDDARADVAMAWARRGRQRRMRTGRMASRARSRSSAIRGRLRR